MEKSSITNYMYTTIYAHKRKTAGDNLYIQALSIALIREVWQEPIMQCISSVSVTAERCTSITDGVVPFSVAIVKIISSGSKVGNMVAQTHLQLEQPTPLEHWGWRGQGRGLQKVPYIQRQ